MAIVNYKDLKLKTNTTVQEFVFEGQTIQVLQYLPANDKYDLIMITLQKAKEVDGTYSQFKLDLFFHLHLIYMYTNIEFTEEERADELTLYDELTSSGFIDRVLSYISDDEYNELMDAMDSAVRKAETYGNSAAGVIRSIMTDLPESAEAAAKIVDTFDPSQYQAVLDFANAANGNRYVSGNMKNQPVLEKV